MKLLQTYQELLAFAFTRGQLLFPWMPRSPNENQQYYFGLNNLFPLIFGFIIPSMALTSYILLEAQTPQQYTETIYANITEIVCASNFICLLWKREKLFLFIDYLEMEIEHRK